MSRVFRVAASVTMFFLAVPVIAASTVDELDLRGSKAVQDGQNQRAKAEGLSRIRSDWQLRKMKRAKLLVPLPSGERLLVDRRIPAKLRYCRPWTKQFLLDLARDYNEQFRSASPLQVNSAVRTERYQTVLRTYNANAAKESSHVVGSTVDIGKIGHSDEELAYIRNYLRALKREGLIEAVEERRQLVFHVMVFKDYATKRGDGAPIATSQ